MTTEKRLIDANVLADKVDYSKYNNPHTNGRVKINHYNEHDHFLRMILDVPTVDAVEVVHGRWEQARYTEAPLYICSKCDKPEYKQHNYCPNCGAKMDGDGNGLVR